MPWKCPACQTQIKHEGDLPEARRVYRCHVCRLELVLDAWTQKLTVAPMPAERASSQRSLSATSTGADFSEVSR